MEARCPLFGSKVSSKVSINEVLSLVIDYETQGSTVVGNLKDINYYRIGRRRLKVVKECSLLL